MAHKTDTTYTLNLTEHEAYTLQLLLGFVAADNEVYSLSRKLGDLTGYETDTYDFDRVVFTVEGNNTGTEVVTDEHSNVVIRIK